MKYVDAILLAFRSSLMKYVAQYAGSSMEALHHRLYLQRWANTLSMRTREILVAAPKWVYSDILSAVEDIN